MTSIQSFRVRSFEARIFDPSQNSYTQAQDIDSVTSIIEQVRAQLHLGEDEALIIPEHTGVVTEHPIDERLANLIDQLRQHLYHSPSRRFSRSCSRHPEMSSSQPSPVSSPDTSSSLRRTRRKPTTRTHRTTPRPSSTTPTAGACRNCETLTGQLEAAQAENAKLREQLETGRLEHSQQVTDLNGQIATLRDQVAMRPGMYANLQAENKKLRAELKRKDREYHAHLEKLNSSMEMITAAHNEALSDLKARIEELETALTKAREERDEANTRAGALQEEVDALRTQLEELAQILPGQPEALGAAVAKGRTNFRQLFKTAQELLQEKTTLQEQLGQTSQRATDLQEEINELRTQVTELKGSIPILLGRAQEEAKTALQNLAEILEQKEEAFNELLEDHNRLLAQVAQFQTFQSYLVSRLQGLGIIEEEEASSLQDKNTTAEDLVAAIESLISHYETSLAARDIMDAISAQSEPLSPLPDTTELERELELAQRRISDLEQLLQSQHQRGLDTAQMIQTNFIDNMEHIEGVYEMALERIRELESELERLESSKNEQIQALDEEVSRKDRKILGLETQLTFLELEKDELSKQSLIAQEELGQQITALRGEIAQLTTARNAQDQVLSELSAENTEQASTIRQLESQIEHLQARTQEAESRLNTIEKSVNSRLNQLGLIQDGTNITAEEGIAILAETVTTLSESVTTLEADLRTASESRLTPAQETELTTARTKLSWVRRNLIAIIRENSRKKDPHLQGKSLEELTHSLSTIISEHKNLIDEMAPLLERADAEINRLNLLLERAKAKIDRLNKLLEKQKRLAKSKIELGVSTRIEKDIIAAKNRADKAEAKCQELTDRINKGDTPNLSARLSAERKLGEANLQIQSLRAELRKIRREKQAPPKRVSLYQPPTKQGRLLHALLIEAQTSEKASNQEAERLRERILQLETTLRSARAAIVELRRQSRSSSAAEPEFVEDLHERYQSIGDQWERDLERQRSLRSEE